MIDYKLKDADYYYSLKEKFNKEPYNSVWHNMSGRKYVGGCIYLCSLYKPKTYEEFYEKYINDINPNNRCCSGRSIDELYELAKVFQEKSDDYSITVEEYLDAIILHVIIETFDGRGPERQVSSFLKDKNYEIIDPIQYFEDKSKYDIDAVMGVDIIARSPQNDLSYIQIKPVSTFIGDRNEKLKEDRSNFYKKQKKLDRFLKSNLSKTNERLPIKEILYMIYKRNLDETIWVMNERDTSIYKGRLLFKLSDLCHKDGTVIYPSIGNFRTKSL